MRGVSELESIADTFKTIPGIHCLTQIEQPLKIYIGFFLTYSAQFVPGFAVINIQIPMNRRNSPKSISGPLVIILVSTRMNSSVKIVGRKRKNYVR